MTIKQIAFWLLIVFFLFVINNLVHSILSLAQKQQLVVKKEQQLVKEKQQNTLLKKQLTQVKQPQFVEQEARNKLFLTKPGEGVLVIDQPQVGSGSSAVAMPNSKPNWLQWWELFF